jgi:hypothetical protein
MVQTDVLSQHFPGHTVEYHKKYEHVESLYSSWNRHSHIVTPNTSRLDSKLTFCKYLQRMDWIKPASVLIQLFSPSVNRVVILLKKIFD